MQKVEPDKQLLVQQLAHHRQYNSIWTEQKIAQVVKISIEEVHSYLFPARSSSRPSGL